MCFIFSDLKLLPFSDVTLAKSIYERKIILLPASVCIYFSYKMNTYACMHTQSCLTLVTLWTVACQASLSMEFPWQEY